MSFHIWRKIYYVFGWEYPEKADERQKHLKHCLCKQIKETKDIKSVLKEPGEIKEKEIIHIDLCKKHSVGHYTNALTEIKEIKEIKPLEITTTTRPPTPIPFYAKLDYKKDNINIDEVVEEMKKKYNLPKKRKSKTRKRKSNIKF